MPVANLFSTAAPKLVFFSLKKPKELNFLYKFNFIILLTFLILYKFVNLRHLFLLHKIFDFIHINFYCCLLL